MWWRVIACCSLLACQQDRAFVYVPGAERVMVRYHWTVPDAQTDLLFVVDNSPSMALEHETLRAALPDLLQRFPSSSWRIAMTSTDVEDTVSDGRRDDGVAGRLVAAHDPAAWSLDDLELDDRARQALEAIATASPPEPARFVDGRELWAVACQACGSRLCARHLPDGSDEALECAIQVSRALAVAHLRSNLAGLGTQGSRREQGFEAAKLALLQGRDWLRHLDTRLLFVSDEDDCSRAPSVSGIGCDGEPWPVEEAAEYLQAIVGRLRVYSLTGVVGFLDQIPSDCVPAGEWDADSACRCFEGDDGPSEAWCGLSARDDAGLPLCQALAGPRYMALAEITRGNADSICVEPWFSPRYAYESNCYDLQVEPARNDPSNIRIRRLSRLDAELGLEPEPLDQLDGWGSPGWYEGSDPTQVCILPLLPGDTFEITVLTRDDLDFSR